MQQAYTAYLFRDMSVGSLDGVSQGDPAEDLVGGVGFLCWVDVRVHFVAVSVGMLILFL